MSDTQTAKGSKPVNREQGGVMQPVRRRAPIFTWTDHAKRLREMAAEAQLMSDAAYGDALPIGYGSDYGRKIYDVAYTLRHMADDLEQIAKREGETL